MGEVLFFILGIIAHIIIVIILLVILIKNLFTFNILGAGLSILALFVFLSLSTFVLGISGISAEENNINSNVIEAGDTDEGRTITSDSSNFGQTNDSTTDNSVSLDPYGCFLDSESWVLEKREYTFIETVIIIH